MLLGYVVAYFRLVCGSFQSLIDVNGFVIEKCWGSVVREVLFFVPALSADSAEAEMTFSMIVAEEIEAVSTLKFEGVCCTESCAVAFRGVLAVLCLAVIVGGR